MSTRRGLVLLAVVAISSWDGHAAAKGAPGCGEKDRMKRSSVKAAIDVRQVQVAGRLRVLVRFEFRNTGPEKSRLERWLAIDGGVLTTPLLRIERGDGKPVGYLGVLVSRRPPTGGDFLVLAPGETRVVSNVDVTDAFEFPTTAQQLAIKYEAITQAKDHLEVVESDCKILEYVPAGPKQP